MSNCYSKNCLSCRNCKSGTYHFESHVIDEGNQICILTGNEIVDRFGVEINITPCSNHVEREPQYIPEINIIVQPLPF